MMPLAGGNGNYAMVTTDTRQSAVRRQRTIAQQESVLLPAVEHVDEPVGFFSQYDGLRFLGCGCAAGRRHGRGRNWWVRRAQRHKGAPAVIIHCAASTTLNKIYLLLQKHRCHQPSSIAQLVRACGC